jgi:hypothetical protein
VAQGSFRLALVVMAEQYQQAYDPAALQQNNDESDGDVTS